MRIHLVIHLVDNCMPGWHPLELSSGFYGVEALSGNGVTSVIYRGNTIRTNLESG